MLLIWTTAAFFFLFPVHGVVVENKEYVHLYALESPQKKQPHQSGLSSTTTSYRNLQETNILVGNVTSFVMINTNTNLPIRVLLNNTVINLSAIQTTKLTIQALISPSSPTSKIDEIQFGFDDDFDAGTERTAPYSLCGNISSQLLPCDDLTVGSHTVWATPYYNGKAGTSKRVTFRIVNTTLTTKSCKIPRLTQDTWKDFLPLYPMKIKETQGATIGSDIVVMSGFINNFANATNQTYARNVIVNNGNSTWQRMDDIPVAQGITHAAVAVAGKRIYFCGGFYGSNPGVHIPDCFVYDHTRKPGFGRQWSRISSLPNGGTGGGGMVYDSALNALYYASGGTRDKIKPTRDIFDVDTFYKYELHNPIAGWTNMGTCPHKANHLSAVTAFDKLGNERHFFLGGQIGKDECQNNLNHVYEWNAITMNWTQHTNIPFARGHAPSSTLPISCGFVMAGGSVNSPTGCFKQTSDISYYDIESNIWTSIGNLSNTVNSPVCSIGRDGFFYHVSGTVNRRRIRVDP